jgi:large subunit ribosomal protein L10
MRVEEKQTVVEALSAKLEGATAFILTDFTGLDVKSMTNLRARLRKAGVEYLVVKNTLAKRALANLEVPDIAEFFTGPTGLVIGRADAVTAAKVLGDFAGDHDHRPSVKVGIIERRRLSAEEVDRLGKLPPLEQLHAQLAGVLQAPFAQLAYLLEALLVETAGLLEALREQRDQA